MKIKVAPIRTLSLAAVGMSLFCVSAVAQKVDYSVVQVPEETGVEFVKITKPSDYVYMPKVKYRGRKAEWQVNRILGVSKDGKQLAYLSLRNDAINIFLTDIDKLGSSVQRTNRTKINDFSFSPDGKYILFSEQRGKTNSIFRTDAKSGYICRQITSGDLDYSPMYGPGMKEIFFTRVEKRGASVWGYDVDRNFLASYVPGMSPCPVVGQRALVISRVNTDGKGEIWKVNYDTGVEECLVADPNHNFTTPTVSPDGKWILFVGDGRITVGKNEFVNADIFAARIDGTQLTQLTYHAANDLSPVWSPDGKYIYFISQRGDAEGLPNVWRMTFNY